MATEDKDRKSMQGKKLRESVTLVPVNCILSLYFTHMSHFWSPHPIRVSICATNYKCTLPESWVEVPQHQQEGALAHSQSKEKMEELLAAAVSEEGERTSPEL